MDDFLSGLKTYTSKDLREERNKNKKKDEKQKLADQEPGQHDRELNPFWKAGGDGLPSTSKRSAVASADWLQRSLKRMQQQSQDSDQPIEQIAAERYGSWDAFLLQLEEAEQKDGVPRYRRMSTQYQKGNKKSSKFMRPGEGSSSSRGFMKPVGDDSSSCRGGFLRPEERADAQRRRRERRKSEQESDDKWRQKRFSKDHHKDGWRRSSDEHRKSSSGERERPKEDAQRNKVESSRPRVETSSPQEDIPRPKMESQPKEETPKKAESGQPAVVILTEEDRNRISAKIIKYELMGKNDVAQKLKDKLERSRLAQEKQQKSTAAPQAANKQDEEEEVVLTRTGRDGSVWPIHSSQMEDDDERRRRKKRKAAGNQFDAEGERTRYFNDDHQHSLQDLVRHERSGAGENHDDVVLSRMSAKMFRKTDGDAFTLDDMFESTAGRQKGSDERRAHAKSIADTRKQLRRLDKCKWCYGNKECKRHLIVATGHHSYVQVPSHRPLVEGHCIIVPMTHTSSLMNLDEDVWSEVRQFMSDLTCMFSTSDDSDVIFLQHCADLKRSPHLTIECVPVPREVGEMAPVYYKKALLDCESEWSQNKKVIDTRGTSSVRGKIPPGFPYFAVDFGTDGGFAHAIEDETRFPSYFGREVIGGMLDAGPELWRKPHEEVLAEQTKRTIGLEKMFKPYNQVQPLPSS